MTAGMHRPQKRVLVALAAVASWSVVFAGLAQPAAAADVQSKQWYLSAMQAEEMWKITTGEGIKVAVIDTGVNPSTPSLKGQVLKGLDATGAPGDEHDDYRGHGTNMAELIAGTGNGGGLRGLAPGVKIIPMRISDTEFQNENSVNARDAEDAIRAAADSDAQIISMSFASDYSDQDERAAVKYAQSKGKLFFAGVGNNATEGNKVQYPAAYPQAVGVSSADRNGKVSEFSTNGNSVDIAAPGSDIPRWCNNSFKEYCDGEGGTSAATAIASASAALLGAPAVGLDALGDEGGGGADEGGGLGAVGGLLAVGAGALDLVAEAGDEAVDHGGGEDGEQDDGEAGDDGGEGVGAVAAESAPASPRTMTMTGLTMITAIMMPAQRRTWPHMFLSTRPA
ncbi:serine protease [Streptomyces cavourensis]|nr:serine protease [Streptomyces cavourensis]